METILCKEGYLVPKTPKYNDLINIMKNELTVEPAITCKFGKKDPNARFTVYQENDNYVCVPKYYGIKKCGIPDINKEIVGAKIKIKFKGKLRPDQKIVMDLVTKHMKEKDGGVLCLGCGKGKTTDSLYYICKEKKKALVIVHKTFLLNQWVERAQQFTDAKIGIIQQNKIDIEGKDIVIGMLQSIAKEKYDSEIFKDFGIVIFDEAHHAPSKYFSRALPLIACKKTIGLSATPKRNDKLEKVLYWYFGDIMYKEDAAQNETVLVNIINYTIEHEKFKEYKMYTGDVNRPKTINKITTIGRRNKFIIDMLIKVVTENPKRKVLVLSDRIEHLNTMKKRLNSLNNIITSDFYIGGMKQKDLKVSETCQVIFASYSMAAEALDIPALNTLFMVTSRREVEQAVGRIIRKIDPLVRPTIYDFTDMLPSFVRQCNNRIKLYKKMGFEIKTIEVKENEIIGESEVTYNSNKNEDIIETDGKVEFLD